MWRQTSISCQSLLAGPECRVTESRDAVDTQQDVSVCCNTLMTSLLWALSSVTLFSRAFSFEIKKEEDGRPSVGAAVAACTHLLHCFILTKCVCLSLSSPSWYSLDLLTNYTLNSNSNLYSNSCLVFQSLSSRYFGFFYPMISRTKFGKAVRGRDAEAATRQSNKSRKNA